METDEIFADICTHLIEGLMFHDQMASYFAFLGLKGFADEQNYHFMSETATYSKVNRYFVAHYNKLLPEKELKLTTQIPSGWHNYTRQDVDSSTRRNAVKEAFEKWVAWETATKKLYEDSVKELYDLGHVAGAIVIEKLVADVDNELENAERERLELESAGYDSVFISDIQKNISMRIEMMCI